MARRAITSSPVSPNTRQFWTHASTSKREGKELLICRLIILDILIWISLRNSITDKTILISIMYANNEIGVLQPIRGNRQDCQGKRRVVPFRWGSGDREDTGGCPGQCRFDFDVRRTRFTARKASARFMSAEKARAFSYRSDGWRWARTRNAFGNAECSGYRRPGKGMRYCTRVMPEESKRMSYLRDKLNNKLNGTG